MGNSYKIVNIQIAKCERDNVTENRGISSSEDAIYKTEKEIKEHINDKNLKEQIEEPKAEKESKTLENVTLQEPNKTTTKEKQKRKEKSKLGGAEDKWVVNEDKKISKDYKEAQTQKTIKQKELTQENTALIPLL